MVTDVIDHYRQRVERELDARLPPANTHPKRLHEAMRYAVQAGGKRLRPLLVYAAGAVVGTLPEQLDAEACAVELIHTYSLIHDDLPAMDDDDLRRGQPSCHKAFGEATAILAGDALQALAFQVLAEGSASHRLPAITLLAQAVGSRGMVGGQAIDLAAIGQSLSLAELEDMHIHKTGALIRACVLLGAQHSKSKAQPEVVAKLDRFAKCIGLAFQIRDDILDEVTDTEILGKPQGTDRAHDKPTYPTVLGLADAREHAEMLYQDALHQLEGFGERAAALRWIADYIVSREY